MIYITHTTEFCDWVTIYLSSNSSADALTCNIKLKVLKMKRQKMLLEDKIRIKRDLCSHDSCNSNSEVQNHIKTWKGEGSPLTREKKT